MGAFAGADTLVAALEQCRRDSTVAAVVLRVNSPGGSAFASDVVAREIKKRARRRQADRRLDGRHGGLGRLLHLRARRRHLRRPLDAQRVDRRLRLQGRRAEAARDAGDQRRDLSPRRPRRLPVALPAVDRRRSARWSSSRSATSTSCSSPPSPTGAARAASPPRASTSSARGTSGPARRRRGWGSSIGWAASPRRSTRRRAWAACPSRRDQVPELVLLPVEKKGLLRRLAGAASVLAARPADERGAPPATGERLLTGDARAALRLLAPFLVQGTPARPGCRTTSISLREILSTHARAHGARFTDDTRRPYEPDSRTVPLDGRSDAD